MEDTRQATIDLEESKQSKLNEWEVLHQKRGYWAIKRTKTCCFPR